MSRKAIVVEQDDILACPKCKAPLAKLNRDLYFGHFVGEDDFEPIYQGEWSVKNGDVTISPCCKELYVRGGSLYILDKGWCPPRQADGTSQKNLEG